MRKYNIKNCPSNINILALDDDPMMTLTLQSYFQAASGYNVDIENDPLRAIERIKRDHYDILLLDFLMRPINGREVVKEIRKFNNDIYIILLTGHISLAPPLADRAFGNMRVTRERVGKTRGDGQGRNRGHVTLRKQLRLLTA